MSRIAALQPPYAPDIQQQFDRIMRGAPPLMLFRVIAGNARAWEKFRAGSLLDRGPLSLREREIVIDRTCALTGCEYEWGVHVATFADAAHLTEGQVRATVAPEAPCQTPTARRAAPPFRPTGRGCRDGVANAGLSSWLCPFLSAVSLSPGPH